jgi:hypothetical protein
MGNINTLCHSVSTIQSTQRQYDCINSVRVISKLCLSLLFSFASNVSLWSYRKPGGQGIELVYADDSNLYGEKKYRKEQKGIVNQNDL